ncbi:hypothetical protein GCM10007973_30490 [Polymorphobacter multimanifer]|nr:hypothetical protein GCM10007973_30490 [Polymorphobacter multimanifer]
MTDLVRIERALLSVSDKTGLEALAAALVAHGIELVSTGGTAAALRAMGHDVRDVAELTGSPEMMDGRVKTLHPRVHGGLLGVRGNPEHMAAMTAHGIAPIDLAVINLYPFAATVAKGAPREDIIENIDIGGPAMVRAAAKNHESVAILTDPAQYQGLIDALAEHAGATPLALRRQLAAAAYAHTAAYDAAVASWFAFADQGEAFPATLPLALTRVETLRYGENPHQSAALYRPQTGASGVAAARQLQGKALSYNNLNDADGALELIAEFRDAGPSCAIIKHANPCGVATGATLAAAYEAAFQCDPVSAFGGIIALNAPLDFFRSSSPPMPMPKRSRSLPPRRTCACCSLLSPIRAGPAWHSARSEAACSCRRATMPPSRAPTAPSSAPAPPATPNGPTCCSPGPWRAM